jgi:hypothetical protein
MFCRTSRKPAHIVQQRCIISCSTGGRVVEPQELYGIARALLLAGGVVAIVLGGLRLLGAALRTSGIDAVKPVFGIAVGVVALATFNQVKNEAIEIVLIVLGLISGNVGGT